VIALRTLQFEPVTYLLQFWLTVLTFWTTEWEHNVAIGGRPNLF
jgi:hypothetical protein